MNGLPRSSPQISAKQLVDVSFLPKLPASDLAQLTNDDVCDEYNFPSLQPLRKYGMYIYKWSNDGLYWTHFGLMLQSDVVNFFTIRNERRLKEIEMKTKSPLVMENDVIAGKVYSFIVFYRGSVPYIRDGIHDFTTVETMTDALRQICSFILSVVASNQENFSKNSAAAPSSPSNNSADSDRISHSISCGSTTSSDEKFTIIRKEKKDHKGSRDSEHVKRSVQVGFIGVSETVRIPHDSIGWIFGKRGKRLESIMEKTDTTITLCATNKQNTKLLVQSNERNKVEQGVKLVLEAVAEIGGDT